MRREERRAVCGGVDEDRRSHRLIAFHRACQNDPHQKSEDPLGKVRMVDAKYR